MRIRKEPVFSCPLGACWTLSWISEPGSGTVTSHVSASGVSTCPWQTNSCHPCHCEILLLWNHTLLVIWISLRTNALYGNILLFASSSPRPFTVEAVLGETVRSGDVVPTVSSFVILAISNYCPNNKILNISIYFSFFHHRFLFWLFWMFLF